MFALEADKLFNTSLFGVGILEIKQFDELSYSSINFLVALTAVKVYNKSLLCVEPLSFSNVTGLCESKKITFS